MHVSMSLFPIFLWSMADTITPYRKRSMTKTFPKMKKKHPWLSRFPKKRTKMQFLKIGDLLILVLLFGNTIKSQLFQCSYCYQNYSFKNFTYSWYCDTCDTKGDCIKQFVVTNCSKERSDSIVTKTLKNWTLISIATSKESNFNADFKYISFIKFSHSHQKLRAWENSPYLGK